MTLPRLGPAIFAAASLVFLYCITSYGLIRVLGGVKITTLEVEIYLETASYLNLSGAAVLSILQILIVLAALGINGVARARFERAGALRTVPPRRVRREDIFALVLTCFGILLVAVPLIFMVVASLRLAGRWTLANYRALGQPGIVAQLPGTAWGGVGVFPAGGVALLRDFPGHGVVSGSGRVPPSAAELAVARGSGTVRYAVFLSPRRQRGYGGFRNVDNFAGPAAFPAR